MIYLLDTSALLAFAFAKHVHHARVRDWLYMRRLEHGDGNVILATCAITELGFIRVASGKRRLAESVQAARASLRCVKDAEQFVFFTDHLIAEFLPRWVQSPAQTTHGHLFMLAKAHGACFATLDAEVPDAHLIPDSACGVTDIPYSIQHYGRA